MAGLTFAHAADLRLDLPFSAPNRKGAGFLDMVHGVRVRT